MGTRRDLVVLAQLGQIAELKRTAANASTFVVYLVTFSLKDLTLAN
jgi:hypothetical protein